MWRDFLINFILPPCASTCFRTLETSGEMPLLVAYRCRFAGGIFDLHIHAQKIKKEAFRSRKGGHPKM